MESFLWALNLLGVCLLCAWALKEDSRPPDSDDAAEEKQAGPDQANASARRQGRPPLPRK